MSSYDLSSAVSRSVKTHDYDLLCHLYNCDNDLIVIHAVEHWDHEYNIFLAFRLRKQKLHWAAMTNNIGI